MKTIIFCDIADFKTIKFYNNKTLVNGFTTNPSLMRLAGAKNYRNYCLKILKVCKKKPISFEVFADSPKEMLKQAYKINQWGKNVYVKVPVVNSKVSLSALSFSTVKLETTFCDFGKRLASTFSHSTGLSCPFSKGFSWPMATKELEW